MVNIDGAKQEVLRLIGEFERVVYEFDVVTLPTHTKDKEILNSLKTTYLRLEDLSRRVSEGEEISQELIYDLIPEAFR